jgi:ABC-2 type transport system permease protein
MLSSRRLQGPVAQLADLVLVQLSNWRWAWRGLVLTGIITPVAAMIALAAFSGRGSAGQDDRLLVGTLILSLLFQNQSQVAGNFSFMKINGTLDFFATQPVRRALLAVSTVCAFFAISIPALIVTVAVGTILLHVDLSVSPLLLLVLPLCIIPAAGIGAIIGSMTSTIEESSSISLVATFLLTGCGPVLFPASHLPAFVRVIGVANPVTYAAAALRAVLIGPVNAHLAADLLVLAAFGLAAILALLRLMPWRLR